MSNSERWGYRQSFAFTTVLSSRLQNACQSLLKQHKFVDEALLLDIYRSQRYIWLLWSMESYNQIVLIWGQAIYKDYTSENINFDVVCSSYQRRGTTCTLFKDLSSLWQHFWRCSKALQSRSYFTSTGPPWGPSWSGALTEKLPINFPNFTDGKSYTRLWILPVVGQRREPKKYSGANNWRWIGCKWHNMNHYYEQPKCCGFRKLR